MFGKLKDKLKDTLNLFSKKTEQEAEEKQVEQKVEESSPSAEELVEESKQEETPSKQESPKEPKEEPEEESKEESKEELEEEPKEELTGELPTEKLTPKLESIPEPEPQFKLESTSEQKEKTQEKETPTPEPQQEPKETPSPEPEKKSLFQKIKQTVTTKTISEDKFNQLFWDLELALLENNVSVEVIEKIKQDLKQELVDKPLPRDVPKKIEETLKKTLTEILNFDKIDLLEKAKNKKPLVIALFGINGSGKTTSIAKLTNYFKENNLSVVLSACDTFRAAAIQQLEEHAHNLGVKMIKHEYGSDAAAVAFDSVKYAEKNNLDVVLIDTAGRLHSNINLMAELEKIIRVTNPDLKIFIGESITGNDCIEQAKRFNELVEMDGSILTKADIDENGGAPLSISYTIKKPILFLGTGQEYKDLEPFNPQTILERLGF